MNLDQFQKKLEQLLQNLDYKDKNQNDLVCTGFVLVSEWADAGFAKYIHTVMSETMSPWSAYGMLSFAMENDLYDEEDEEDD